MHDQVCLYPFFACAGNILPQLFDQVVPTLRAVFGPKAWFFDGDGNLRAKLSEALASVHDGLRAQELFWDILSTAPAARELAEAQREELFIFAPFFGYQGVAEALRRGATPNTVMERQRQFVATNLKALGIHAPVYAFVAGDPVEPSLSDYTENVPKQRLPLRITLDGARKIPSVAGAFTSATICMLHQQDVFATAAD